MPRRTYDPRKGRHRPQQQRSDFTWLLEHLALRHRPARHQQTTGDQRGPKEKTRP
jgi:hypothetical protein